jgi:hypothetical protein
MNFPTSDRRGKIRWLFTALALAAATTVPAVPATAAPSSKYYEISATPTSIYVDTASAATITLSNDASSSQSFGSAQLTFNGLSSSQVTLSSSAVDRAGWSAQLVRDNPAVVQLTSSTNAGSVGPGDSVAITVTLNASSVAPIAISSAVKQANDFSGQRNDFQRVGADPTIQVLAYQLSFAQEPPNALQQSTPTTNMGFMCPPVSVQLEDSSGTPVSQSGVPVTVSVAGSSPDPGLYYGSSPASSVTVKTNASGQAVFGSQTSGQCSLGFAAVNLGTGYQLSAAAPGSSSVASTPFAVVQSVQTCNGSCTTTQLTSSNTGTSAFVNVSNGPDSFDLVASFGLGNELTCANEVSTVTADPFVTYASGATTGAVHKTISMTFSKAVVNSIPDNGTPHMPVCAGATAPFAGSMLTSSTTYPYQGLLYDCTDPTYLSSTDALQMCVQSRAKLAGGAETVVVASNSPTDIDPMYW